MNNQEKYREECGRIHACPAWKSETAAKMAKESRRYSKVLRWSLTGALAGALVFALVFSPLFRPATITAKAQDNLMEGIQPQKQEIPAAPDSDFISAQSDFAVRLFQKTVSADKNTLVSPASASLALGMAANGAKGGTLSQFEALLGGRDLAALNRNFASEQSMLKSSSAGKVLLANSIWYRNKNLFLQKPFLQSNADWFGADAFRLNFASPASVEKINAWVSKSTDGHIKKILDKISSGDQMFLLNALYLEQDWKYPYNGNVSGTFHAPGGNRTVPMMHSTETYLSGGGAEGILKPFKDSRYAFAAILPRGGTSAADYVQNLTGEKFLSLMRSAGKETAVGTMPKFKFNCSLNLKKPLQSLGLTDAFDENRADFSAMGRSSEGSLFLSGVQQETFIQADELGLKAGAATELACGATAAKVKPRTVSFDRPFVVAVVETQTNLPVFLGMVAEPAA